MDREPDLSPPAKPSPFLPGEEYRSRVAGEKRSFEHCCDIHSLPPIFHYWSNRHILPKLRSRGFDSPQEVFDRSLLEQCRRPAQSKRFVSLACGNCDAEIGMALQLREQGCTNFVFDCIDLNRAMLERGERLAGAASLADHFVFHEADLNAWGPSAEYDAAIANYALHHIANLEGLFTGLRSSLRESGTLVIADIIGRNGHRRWPEAFDLVQEFWRKLPPSYRFNRTSGGYEGWYEDWDCSQGTFEGIRSQDILPLLLELFHFSLFIPFGKHH